MPQPIGSYWKYVKPLFDKVDTGDPASFFASSAKVSRPELLLFAAHFCLSEVHNGGLLQFFWNSTGILAPEAIEGFRAIGMRGLASIVEKATRPLGAPYPRDREDRWDALLAASGRTDSELKEIFARNENLYLAFQEAADPMGLEAMSERLWELAQTENGDFQEAATRYAQALEPNE